MDNLKLKNSCALKSKENIKMPIKSSLYLKFFHLCKPNYKNNTNKPFFKHVNQRIYQKPGRKIFFTHFA
jgi:hypothetical protein